MGDLSEDKAVGEDWDLTKKEFPQTDDPFELLWVLPGPENLMGVEFDGDNLWLAHPSAIPVRISSQ